jgi:sugar lactone lactonase YvrE
VLDFSDLAEGLNHPEGVAWNPTDGRVYCGGEAGEIYAVSLRGDVEEIARTGGSMLGVAVDGRGRVYGCDAGNGEIVRVNLLGDVEVYARGMLGEGLDTPNMLAFDREGFLFVTCSGEEGDPSIVRIPPGGGGTQLWSRDCPGYPNGCLVRGDGADEELVVVESQAQRLVRIPIGPEDGAAAAPIVIAELPDTDADGVALDAEGHLWVTLYRPDGLLRVAPDGKVETVVDDHLARTFDAPTNLAFAGAELDQMVVANVGDRFLSICSPGVKGARLRYPAVP